MKRLNNDVAVIGASGFIGSEICKKLKELGLNTKTISRQQIDLYNETDVEKLALELSRVRKVVFCAAKAPARTISDLEYNIVLAKNFIEATKFCELEYILNISSDAVYPDANEPITETLIPLPASMHGLMHLCREQLLDLEAKSEFIGHLRSTLVFGPGDPHNGYGPNKFIREAKQTGVVTLFGLGEELRDHIDVSDLAQIAAAMVQEKIEGPVNGVTGMGITFREIADEIFEALGTKAQIKSVKRSGAMPHNGYRVFDNSKAKSLLPKHQWATFATKVSRILSSY